jgi:transposase
MPMRSPPHGFQTSSLRLVRLHPQGAQVENAFAKLKALLRKVEARTREDLWDAITSALKQFSAQECANYFNAAGYKPA